jgi:hypothetical protein
MGMVHIDNTRGMAIRILTLSIPESCQFDTEARNSRIVLSDTAR